jgi:hypothetical protein
MLSMFLATYGIDFEELAFLYLYAIARDPKSTFSES